MGTPEPWHPSLTQLELSDPPIWLGDGHTLQAPGYHWGAAALELTSAPGLNPGQSAMDEALAQRRLSGRLVRTLRPWQNAGGLELRYVWEPPGRLRILFIGRALGQSLGSARRWATQLLDTVVGQFPPGYSFGPLSRHLPDGMDDWVEIERAEEVRSPGPFVPPGIADYYYLVHPFVGDGTAWPELPRVLIGLSRPGFLSIALIPTVMTAGERAAVDHVTTLARHLSEPQSGYDFFGDQTTTPADAGARDVELAWQQFNAADGVLARIGVAGSPVDTPQVAATIAGIISARSDRPDGLPNRHKLVAHLNEWEAWQTVAMGVVLPRARHEVWSRPAEQAPVPLERLPYFFTDDDAAGVLVLPVPDADGVPGLTRARRITELRESINPPTIGPSVRIGAALHHGAAATPVDLPLTSINRHTLIVGSPGSGKTSTVLSILLRLWCDHRVPFMVIESVKTEYRSLLNVPGMEELNVITIGNESIAPLRLNPLQPPPGVRCEIHRGSVLAALKLALPLFPPLPQLLAKALTSTYRQAGWNDDNVSEDGLVPPTLRDLLRCFEEGFDSIGYQGEAKNIGLAFQVRLEGLLEGGRGKMLDTIASVDFQAMLEGPIVVELDDIVDADERAVVAAFLLDRVRATARARGSSAGQLRHVTVVEEAHRLLSRGAQRSGDAAGGDQARAAAVDAFCEAIAELRSSGEGFILSSQSPSLLADAAVANTGTRILHRLESATDRKYMLADVGDDDRLRASASTLAVGEVIMRWPERDTAELVSVQPDSSIDSGRVVTDETVRAAMREHREHVRSLLPARLCTQEICRHGCSVTVRDKATLATEHLAGPVGATWSTAHASRGDVLPKLASLLAADADYDLQTAYCTAVQLSNQGHAFRTRGQSDDRPLLSAAIRQAVINGPQ